MHLLLFRSPITHLVGAGVRPAAVSDLGRFGRRTGAVDPLAMAAQKWFAARQVVGNQFIDQLDHALPMIASRGEVGQFLSRAGRALATATAHPQIRRKA